MRISVRARAAVVAVAVAAGGLVAMPLASPGGAALKSSVACGKLSSSKLANGKSTSVLSNCTPTALKAGATTVTLKTPPPGSQSGTVGSKLTWKGGKGTTTLAVKFVLQKKPGNCPKGTTRINATGTVKIVTGAAKAIIKVNEPFTATVCAFVSGPKAGQTVLAPGTKYKL